MIEAPTGHENDDEIECETMPWNGSYMGKFLLAYIVVTHLIPSLYNCS